MSSYYVYVLRSQRDGKLYIGLTERIEDRLGRHNQGKVPSTKSRRPFSLIYSEKFIDCVSARKREKFLKSGVGRKLIQNLQARVAEPADAHV